MEDDLNFEPNGRRPQFFNKMEYDLNWLSVSKVDPQLEDDLHFFVNGRRPQIFNKLEDNLNYSIKWKTTSIFQ